MLTAQQRLARRVAARWVLNQLDSWKPPIPQAIQTRLGYLPNTPALKALDDARDSIAVFLPKLLKVLHKTQGERYYMNARESKGKLFYFFSPRQPVDTFSLTLWILADKAQLSFSFLPYKVNRSPDFQNMISDHASTEPEMAGLAFMRLVRSVLQTKARRNLS